MADIGCAGILVADTFCGPLPALPREGELLARYPDLIIALDALSGLPLTIGEMTKGRKVLLLTIPAHGLKLGSGATDPGLLESLEALTGISLIR